MMSWQCMYDVIFTLHATGAGSTNNSGARTARAGSNANSNNTSMERCSQPASHAGASEQLAVYTAGEQVISGTERVVRIPHQHTDTDAIPRRPAQQTTPLKTTAAAVHVERLQHACGVRVCASAWGA
eukprot:scpid13452/ scgid29683/ 